MRAGLSIWPRRLFPRFAPRSILRQFVWSASISLVLALFSIALIYLNMPGDRQAVNLAGRQRMLIERITRKAFLVSQDQNGRTGLHRLFERFEQSHRLLLQGAPETGIAPLMTPVIRGQLNKVWNQWRDYKGVLRHYMEDPNAAKRDRIQGQATRLVEEMDQAVGMITREANRTAQWGQWLAIGLIGGIVLVGGSVTVVTGRRISRSVKALDHSISQVDRVAELREVKEVPQVGLSELDGLANQASHLADRLRATAVDRDLLEFEIRLLEQFVITSEVVQDWREYVKQLIKEINSVLEVYLLFSLFQSDDETSDLEIFWRAPPTEASKTSVVQSVHKAVAHYPAFEETGEFTIRHHIVEAASPAVDYDPEAISLAHKNLVLGIPKVTGIVGIGIAARAKEDPRRNLVTESILSTLINVLGSVQALSQYTQDLEYYAARDPLTEVYNSRIFRELLHYEVERAKRRGSTFGILMVDLDNFKTINDTYGHAFGDQFLQECARLLEVNLRAGDLIARFGGDEFSLLLPEIDFEQTVEVAHRLIRSAEGMRLVTPNGESIQASFSVGMAIYPDHAETAQDLIMFADNMMYRAKEEGKARVTWPTEEDLVDSFRQTGEKGRLVLNAIENHQVHPYYQPIWSLGGMGIIGYELLARIVAESGEVVPAKAFIEYAERMGVIHQLDHLVMEQSFQEARESAYSGLLFINLSPRALLRPASVEDIVWFVDHYGIDPGKVVFELTERETAGNLALLEQFIQQLKRRGFRFAVDDFGSGFGSFHYIRRFPIDYVKIEGEFINNLTQDGPDSAFVNAIVGLAGELGISTIAECVEDEATLERVQENGIELAQGFFLGWPKPSFEVSERGLNSQSI